jgi:hypothetical protein
MYATAYLHHYLNLNSTQKFCSYVNGTQCRTGHFYLLYTVTYNFFICRNFVQKILMYFIIHLRLCICMYIWSIYVCTVYIYTHSTHVFTNEWCGLKNLLNDYILQLDGAPPTFTGMYESYSIVFSNSAGSDVVQMETTTYTYYMGRMRLSCGCVSCNPGCTH